MLIILSGTESINKNFLAKKIFCELNPPFNLSGGYTIKFNSEFDSSETSKSFIANPYEIYDPNGNVVYSQYTNNNSLLLEEGGAPSAEGMAIWQEAEALYDSLFLDIQASSSYNALFVDIEYDLGFDTSCYEWDERDQWHSFPHSYDAVMNRYKNRNYPVHVINGSFSKAFIDLVKQDIGAENVRVFNIVRHPTVSTYLNEKSDSYYVKNTKMTVERNRSIAVKSAINAYILSSYEGCTTLKFEDLMNEGFITIEGKRIDIPEGYTDYNGYISVWEKDNVNWDHIDVNAVEFECDKYSNFRSGMEKEYNTTAPNIAESILESLGYSKITLEQIVAPKE